VVVGRVSGSENRWGFEGEAKSELADVGKNQASVRTGAWHFGAPRQGRGKSESRIEAPLVDFSRGKQCKHFEPQCKQTRERIACQYGWVK
jgi:hypothetical protein